MGVFALSTPAVLWILWGLVGRSLSPLEITGVVGAVATIVASFTRAFGSDQKETTSTSDHQGLDVASPLDLLAASPAVDKPDSPVTSESADGHKGGDQPEEFTLDNPCHAACVPGNTDRSRRPGGSAGKRGRISRSHAVD